MYLKAVICTGLKKVFRYISVAVICLYLVQIFQNPVVQLSHFMYHLLGNTLHEHYIDHDNAPHLSLSHSEYLQIRELFDHQHIDFIDKAIRYLQTESPGGTIQENTFTNEMRSINKHQPTPDYKSPVLGNKDILLGLLNTHRVYESFISIETPPPELGIHF
jgi:hypothetical protein